VPEWFVIIFNLCVLTGFHPVSWKMATIAIIPKPGKSDYTLPKSYWPVTLLECLSKLLEKVMAKHMIHDIGKFKRIPSNQFSACPHSSTIHAGLALTHNINVTHTQGGCCRSLQFNIRGFFNNINHAWLVQTFCCISFAKNVCDWLASFLED
jgi:Reverse transcriptase (RNA-dependent DNA polymerase)